MRPSAYDMTRGAPAPMLLRFALPLMLGSFFQQLYSFVDTAIVGRGISVDALSAVGVTGSLSFVILGFAMGSCAGFCIPIAQNVGAGDREQTSRFFWNGLYAACGIGLLLSLAAAPFVRQLLVMMNTPAQLLDMAVEYLTVIILGTLPSVAYNYLAGVLRAFGDSRHPFYFLLISSGLNVVLDLTFILVLHLGVMGAALATILSQAVSALLCTWWLFRKLGTIQTGAAYRRFSFDHLSKMFRIGLPLGFESCVTSLGFLVLQSAINTLVYLLLGDTATPEALGAIQYIRIVSALFLLQGTMKVLRGVVQGMGFGFAAFLSGVMEILGRILGGRLAVFFGSFTLICLSNPLAWGLSCIYCAFAAGYYLRKKTREFGQMAA